MQDQEDTQDQQDQENNQGQYDNTDAQSQENPGEAAPSFGQESSEQPDIISDGDLDDHQDNHDEQFEQHQDGEQNEAHEENSDAPAAEDTPSQEDEIASPVLGKKILLVEDDEALAAVYRSRLELEGFEIHEVHNGEEALQAAKDVQPDLILLDAMMPKISGFDVLDILRHTPETANVRVVMLTALSQPKDKEKAESLGVDDYLVKSQVVIGDVVDRVKHHLGMAS